MGGARARGAEAGRLRRHHRPHQAPQEHGRARAGRRDRDRSGARILSHAQGLGGDLRARGEGLHAGRPREPRRADGQLCRNGAAARHLRHAASAWTGAASAGARRRAMAPSDYRPFLPTQSKIAGPTARAHAEARLKSPRAQELFGTWDQLLAEPYRGITTDGTVIPGLYALAPNGAPVAAMAEAASALLARLTPEQRARSVFPI